MYFDLKTFDFTKMVCWDASLSCAEGRMESSRAQICDHRPLTAPSRITVKSLMLIHSHRKTCPVMATTSTRKPSPDTWSDSRVAFSVKTQIKHTTNGQRHKNQRWVKKTWSLFLVVVYLEQRPWDEVFLGLPQQFSPGPYPCSTETVLLRPVGHKATTLQWEIDKVFTVWTGYYQGYFCFEVRVRVGVRVMLNTPLCDEAIVTTWLRNGWILGIFFLVRPDTKLISLIRLSSNRNTDSLS